MCLCPYRTHAVRNARQINKVALNFLNFFGQRTVSAGGGSRRKHSSAACKNIFNATDPPDLIHAHFLRLRAAGRTWWMQSPHWSKRQNNSLKRACRVTPPVEYTAFTVVRWRTAWIYRSRDWVSWSRIIMPHATITKFAATGSQILEFRGKRRVGRYKCPKPPDFCTMKSCKQTTYRASNENAL